MVDDRAEQSLYQTSIYICMHVVHLLQRFYLFLFLDGGSIAMFERDKIRITGLVLYTGPLLDLQLSFYGCSHGATLLERIFLH